MEDQQTFQAKLAHMMGEFESEISLISAKIEQILHRQTLDQYSLEQKRGMWNELRMLVGKRKHLNNLKNEYIDRAIKQNQGVV